MTAPVVSRRRRRARPAARRFAQSRAHRRGVALVMVLGALSILTVILAEFQDEASAEASAAIADRDALKAEYVARSAVNLSRLLIAAEPTIRAPVAPMLAIAFGGQSPQLPVWEFADQILGAFNDEKATQGFAAMAGLDLSKGRNMGMKGARFDLSIVDEDSKINVNLASRDSFSQIRLASELIGLMRGEQYNPLFEARDAEGTFHDRATICGALVDWADNDEQLFTCDLSNTQNTASGAEDGYYQILKTPYRRKNAPYDSVEELHLVRGMSEDFWSTFVDPEPSNPKKRTLTVWGQGAINVNTANAFTIWSFLCGETVAVQNPPQPVCVDPLVTAKFMTAMNLVRSMLAGFPVFGSPGAFIKMAKGEGPFGALLKDALGIDPMKFKSESEARKALTTESKVFSIYADGVVPGYRRTTKVRIHAVVDFRDAPPPGTGFAGIAMASPSGSGATPTAAPVSSGVRSVPANAGSTSAADALTGALVKNPGGSIVYYRIE